MVLVINIFYGFVINILYGTMPAQVLNSGRVIPGYGHAVLRKTDPRFTSQARPGSPRTW